MENENYKNNEYIELAVSEIHRSKHVETYYMLLDILVKRIKENGEAPMPMAIVEGTFPFPEIPEGDLSEEFLDSLVGQQVTLNEDVRFRMDTVQGPDRKLWIPLFTSNDELYKAPTTNVIMNIAIEQILRAGLGDDVEGVVINPFGQPLEIPKHIIDIMFNKVMGRNT